MFAASSRHARDERIWRGHRTACGNPLASPAVARWDRALSTTAAGNTGAGRDGAACTAATGAGLSSFGGSSRFGASGLATGGSGAIGLIAGADTASGRGVTGSVDCGNRARATARPLSKSAALSHSLACMLAMRLSSHNLMTSMSKKPCSFWSINCIPWPVTAHCLPIQWMSRCNAICAFAICRARSP